MGNTKKQLESENMSMNFSKGWGVIFYCMGMFFFLVGFSIDGLNIIAPAFAQRTGIDYSTVLGMSTIAGLIGILAYIIIARINIKFGPRIVSGACLIGAGVSYIGWGRTSTLIGYTVWLTLVTSFINGAAYIAGGVLVAQWFPKKKGLANGFTTMGHNMGSAFFVPIISALIAGYGMANGMTFAAFGAIALGVIGLLFIRDIPQERNMYPDNVTKEVYEREYWVESEEVEKIWTLGKLLKTKEIWLCSFIIGINQLVTTGVMSQLVVRNIQIGFTQANAIALMTLCAGIGVVGSFLFGAIDQKYGVKKAILIYLALYCVALAINCTDTVLGVYISVGMIGVAIGAAANFIVSLPASIFGRHGFSDINSVFFPMMQVVLMMNYVVNAVALRITGSLRGAYIVYIVLLLINMVLTSITDIKKYNKDYEVEEIIISDTKNL